MKNRVYLLPIVALSCFFAHASEMYPGLTPENLDYLIKFKKTQYDYMAPAYEDDTATLEKHVNEFADKEYQRLLNEQNPERPRKRKNF